MASSDPVEDGDDAMRQDLEKARAMVETVHEAVNEMLRGPDGEISPKGEIFLEWFALVAGANRSSFHSNDRVHCYREGRRSLFYEFNQFVHLTTEQIMLLRERKYLR